jgi:hypothetical protein
MSAFRTREREACAVSVKGAYRLRRPRTSPLWRCLVSHFELRFSDMCTCGGSTGARSAVRRHGLRSVYDDPPAAAEDNDSSSAEEAKAFPDYDAVDPSPVYD